jgi:predicted phosphate transport protein (TIGR00153 family)
MRLFGRKDEQLFQLFKDSARIVTRGGEILDNVVKDYTDLDAKMAKLTALEHEGDKIIQELMEKLNTSFVLPFDREDAFELAQKLDNTLDYISGIIDRMIMYKAAEPNETVIEMVNLLLQALSEQEKAFNMLDSIPKRKYDILECCERIKNLEREEDGLYRNGLAQLFETETDPIKVIKYKEAYEHIETAVDYCEDVSDVITNICIKYG